MRPVPLLICGGGQRDWLAAPATVEMRDERGIVMGLIRDVWRRLMNPWRPPGRETKTDDGMNDEVQQMLAEAEAYIAKLYDTNPSYRAYVERRIAGDGPTVADLEAQFAQTGGE